MGIIDDMLSDNAVQSTVAAPVDTGEGNTPQENKEAVQAKENKPSKSELELVAGKITETTRIGLSKKSQKKSLTPGQRMIADMVKINKDLGDGTFMMGNDGRLTVKSFHTGSVMFDLALGGGYPEGRMVEIFGMQSSGKTMMALHAIRESQLMGKLCGFVDVERTMTEDRMISLGVDVSDLVIVKPEYAEDTIDHIEAMINSGVKLVVVDSVAAMLPHQEANSDTGDTQVMIMGRIMSKAMRKLTPVCDDNGATIIWLNQIRKTITMSKNNDVTPGGNALPFYCSQRIKIHRNPSEASQLKDEDKNVIGANVQFTIVKNKVASPFEKLTLEIMYDGYINEYKDIVKVLRGYNMVHKIGKTNEVKYGDEAMKVGTTNADIISVLSNRDTRFRIIDMILAKMGDDKKEAIEKARDRYF